MMAQGIWAVELWGLHHTTPKSGAITPKASYHKTFNHTLPRLQDTQQHRMAGVEGASVHGLGQFTSNHD